MKKGGPLKWKKGVKGGINKRKGGYDVSLSFLFFFSETGPHPRLWKKGAGAPEIKKNQENTNNFSLHINNILLKIINILGKKRK